MKYIGYGNYGAFTLSYNYTETIPISVDCNDDAGGGDDHTPVPLPTNPPNPGNGTGITGNEQDELDNMTIPEMKELYIFRIHKEITLNACEAVNICSNSANTLAMGNQDADYLTIGGSMPATGRYHFDNLPNFNSIASLWEENMNNLRNNNSGDHVELLKFGFFLHGNQDFYAHSNYAELLNDFYNDASHEIPFSDVLDNVNGQYDALRNFIEPRLKTGNTNGLMWTFGNTPTAMMLYSVLDLDYKSSHNYMNKDDPKNKVAIYSMRLAEKETIKLLNLIINKCH